ncbi:MAG: hypothetical protein ABSD46_12105 [Bacteroidota bacterium]
MQKYSYVFKVNISPNDISLKRTSINPFKFANLFIQVMFLFIFVLFTFIGYFGFRLAHVKGETMFLLDGIVFFCLLSSIIASLIKWNYLSSYPSNVHISHENISVQFRRLFNADNIVIITSKDQPFLTVDLFYIRPQRRLEVWGQVTLHSLNTRSIVIYCQQQKSKEEAIIQSTQFAKLVAGKSGLIPKEKIHIHNQ